MFIFFILCFLKAPFWRTFSLFAFVFLGILAVQVTSHFYWDTHSVNLATGESRLLEGPIPYGSILTKSIRGALVAVLFLLMPVAVKVLGYIEGFAEGVINRLQRSG